MADNLEQHIVLIANFRNENAMTTAKNLCRILTIEKIFHPRDVDLENHFPQTATQAFDRLRDCLRENFLQHKTLIALCATGIVVRSLADLLQDKYTESPALVMSENSSCIIPLLGGHRGGNILARRIASMLEIPAAITTASDNVLGFALDDPPDGWKISNTPALNPIMARLLAEKPVGLFQQFTDLIFPPCSAFSTHHNDYAVHVGDYPVSHTQHVGLHPPSLVLGVGCERGCNPDHVASLVEEILVQHNLTEKSIAAIATVTLKADEPALHALAKQYKVPLRLFFPEQLETVTTILQKPSSVVFAEIGCHSVSEAAALCCAGDGAERIVVKAKNAHATLTVVRRQMQSEADFVPLNGQKIGKLHIIGTGPGNRENFTLGMLDALKECTMAIGYGLYLDLVNEHILHAKKIHSPLGHEQKRVEQAITLAQQGENVVLICSGDPGIYALATLVYEVLDQLAIRPQFTLNVHAGITAMQGAAAKLGAPLGHDFLAISLSDLLTPPETIRQRVKAAAEGDFVVSFYNPQSKTRRTLLPEAITILRQYRPANTPVAICRNIGREQEKFDLTLLGDLQPDQVDMLSLVMVGNSMTKFTKNLQKAYLYTPRGYIEPISSQTQSEKS